MLIEEPTNTRTISCERCPFRKNKAFREFSGEEFEFISKFKTGELTAEAGSTILLHGANSAHLYTILSGWAFRYKTLADGRRQILNYILPGDFVGLQAAVMNEMQHTVEALTDMTLCLFEREGLWKLYRGQPTLAFDITWLSSREELMLDDHLLSVGRRTALERIAYLLLHLYERADRVGLVKRNCVRFPFTQQHVADMLGLSLVHTNKTLRRLLDRNIFEWTDRDFKLLDREKLAEIASYEPTDTNVRPFI